MIPYQAVSGEGMLPGFVPEKLEITMGGETRQLTGCWVAVCSRKLGAGQFQVLVPPAVFD